MTDSGETVLKDICKDKLPRGLHSWPIDLVTVEHQSAAKAAPSRQRVTDILADLDLDRQPSTEELKALNNFAHSFQRQLLQPPAKAKSQVPDIMSCSHSFSSQDAFNIFDSESD